MSHQPSTTEQLKNTATSTYNDVTSKIAPEEKKPGYDPDKDTRNFKKDEHGNTVKKGDYKDKLNEAAMGRETNEEGLVEKVCSYIPGVSTLQQAAFEQGPPTEETKNSGPPNRPDHDVQVEEFLRKQYHSKSGDGMPDLDKRDGN
ncbi:hypothetical protein LSUB1_G008390 [Lachnellula subtilissima]|uniref:Uncharacterized protein n=1 Tax=Lachnellula subtilissima TaxID=602034 RepID=A0A8H8U6C9_9HELO|nr:hypothetical protein LSUB1_G008390 [Lachnellula subtilissima]